MNGWVVGVVLAVGGSQRQEGYRSKVNWMYDSPILGLKARGLRERAVRMATSRVCFDMSSARLL